MLNTYTVPSVGFDAVVPQFAPPCAPGNEIVSSSPGGVNKPLFRALSMRFFQSSCSCRVRRYGLTSAGVSFCRANGGGFVGKGWVGHACSLGTSLLPTGRSSIGQIGSPVVRLNT